MTRDRPKETKGKENREGKGIRFFKDSILGLSHFSHLQILSAFRLIFACFGWRKVIGPAEEQMA